MLLQEAGASFVTVHPRTKQQSYNGRADWSLIALAKQLLHIPVVSQAQASQAAKHWGQLTGGIARDSKPLPWQVVPIRIVRCVLCTDMPTGLFMCAARGMMCWAEYTSNRPLVPASCTYPSSQVTIRP